MKTVNIGMIGGGFMGKAHSLAYAAMPMFFWPAPAIPVRKIVAEATDALARDAAARFGFEAHTGDWRRVVEDPSVDVVDIATPNDSHAEIAIAAAKAGKHILCEKPMARDAAESKRMLEAAEAAGICHMVAFNYRRTPAVATAARMIADGEIGEIQSFTGTYLQDWSADPDAPLSWRFRKAVAGSGAVGDIGTHVIDMARYLVGEIAAVNAIVKTYVPTRPTQQGGADKLGTRKGGADAPRGIVDVDDEMLTLVRFENGATGTIEATRNAHGRNNYLTFEIHGSRGSILFDYERRDQLQVCFAGDAPGRKGFRTIYTGPQHAYGDSLWPIPALGIGYGETKIIECHDFLKALVEGTQPSPSFVDGYRVALVADAILASSEQQAWVKVG
jgi:predicted dehydrogenase